MKLSESKRLIFSPTDLSNFIHCKHLTSLDKQALNGVLDKPNYTNKVMLALREKGQQFEASFLDSLRQEGKSICIIEPRDPIAQEKTLDAIREGVEVIYQARLGKENEWWGSADFLIRVPHPSALGDYSYEVIDTKLATETKAATIIQISLYSEAIEEIQGKSPEMMWVKTPEAQIGYKVSEYSSYVRLIKRRFLDAVNQSEINTYPEPVQHCDVCTWWENCNKKRRSDDHLSFVAGMGKSQIKEVSIHGIKTLEDFAQVESPIPFKPSNGVTQTYQKLRDQANIQWRSRNQNNKPLHEFLDFQPEKGFFNLPEPSLYDIYLDLEGDPLVEPGGLEYLIGWFHQGQYHALWAKNEAEEKEAFESFMDIVMLLKVKHPEMHIYHYAPYEVSAFKRLMGKYATYQDEMNELLRSKTFIDLYGVVRQSIRASVEKYSIKDLEKFYGFTRELDLKELPKHKSMFEFLLETNRTEDATPEMLDAIQLYNQDDCISTHRLHLWLENLRSQFIQKGVDISRPELKSTEPTEKISEFLERIRPLKEYLRLGLPASLADRSNEQQAKYILAEMLDWYQRERNAKYWEKYRLMSTSSDDLFDEKNAISSLKYTGKSYPDRQSIVFEYEFPKQESELKLGKSVFGQNGQSVGSIFQLDLEAGIIHLKKGRTIDHSFHPSDIFFFEKPLNDEVKVESIIRLAEWAIKNGIDSNSEEFKACRSLLLRSHSDLNVNTLEEEDLLELAKKWAENLDHGYLPIQGPPGSGKSYTASRVIMHLISQGKKIGVTAMSHKVINALLEKVWELSVSLGQPIRMFQKPDVEEKVPWKYIKESKNAFSTLSKCDLLAGTPYLWAREELVESVDYLVIDEAGQLSLIDTLACGAAGKNLILLGDPQQLQQPQQGTHPEGTEISALSHILQDHQTITREQGIFLAKTWRMHPDICAFDSEQFYEGKLYPVDMLRNQEIQGNTRFSGSGLRFVPVNHRSNSNYSPEEVEVVSRIVSELVNGDVLVQESDKTTHILTKSDIKIISPYNLQVDALKEAISEVEIGTVDKFQGQEAPVVIYSVATSSLEDAPRGMEFLYSPNRFNVAVSRAKTLFILVASPTVLEPDCKSPAQIKLANPFCRFLELAKSI